MTRKSYTKQLLFFIVLCLLITAQYSCKKDTTNNQRPPKTNAELIAASSWNWSGQQFKNQDGSLVDQTLSTTQKTDVYTYKADGTFSTTRGGTGISSGTWKLTSDTQLQLTYVDDTGTTVTPTFAFTVSATKFVLSTLTQFQAPDNVGNPHTYYGEVLTFTQ
jgi:hypothetical protein